jgi:hypothetical protein
VPKGGIGDAAAFEGAGAAAVDAKAHINSIGIIRWIMGLLLAEILY